MTTQPGPVPALDPPTVEPERLPTTGLTELDRAVQMLVQQFALHIENALDEVYGALSFAYPGLYVDPEAPTATRVEYRVTETTGHKRHLPPPAAVHAHRLGLLVERRTVTETEWETEPNPNTRKPASVPAHPEVHAEPEPELTPELAEAYAADDRAQAALQVVQA